MSPETEAASQEKPPSDHPNSSAKRRWQPSWWHSRHPIAITYKWARRIVVTIVGFTVLAVGIMMIVLPGPAFVVIPVGLGILSLEFAWARHWLHKVKERTASVVQSVSKRRNGLS